MKSWFRRNYRNIIVGTLLLPPLLVSIISTIHVITYFRLSNYEWLAVTLAIAFEVGALSSLAGLAVIGRIDKSTLWMVFVLLTIMQCLGNTYYAYDFISRHLEADPNWIRNWVELVGFQEDELIFQKRIIAIISGAILPVISLGFLHLIVTYYNSSFNNNDNTPDEKIDTGLEIKQDLKGGGEELPSINTVFRPFEWTEINPFMLHREETEHADKKEQETPKKVKGLRKEGDDYVPVFE